MRELFGFPMAASGLFVTGTSMANLIAVLVARDAALGFDTRRTGVAAGKKQLTAYTSVAAHGSLAQGVRLLRAGKRRSAAGSGGFAASDESRGAAAA